MGTIDGVSLAIAANAKRQRHALDMTQSEVAHLCGVTRQQIAMIERQRSGVTAYMLVRLADALDMHPAELLGDVDRPWKARKNA